MPANSVIQFRRGTASQWTSANPVLANGEPGYETDTGKEKRGDGTTAWAALAYLGSGAFAPLSTFDIKTYGAVADYNTGTNTGTDNLSAINAAIAAAVAAGGGYVVVPFGQFGFTGTPAVGGSDVTMVGFGEGSALHAMGSSRTNAIKFQVTSSRGFRGGMQGLRLLCHGLITNPIFVDSWHDWIAWRVVASDYTGMMFDITSDQSVYTEMVRIEKCDSIRGAASVKPQGFARIRAGVTGLCTDFVLRDNNIFSLLGWGIELRNAQRCRVEQFIAANNADDFSGGCVIWSATDSGKFVGGAYGSHSIDDLYVENNGAPSGTAVGVQIESLSGATIQNTGSDVARVRVQPESRCMFKVRNSSGTANLTRSNTFRDPRQPPVAAGNIDIGSSCFRTEIRVPGENDKLSAAVVDAGLTSKINGLVSAAYGVATTPSGVGLDVGDIIRNTSDDTFWTKDPAGVVQRLSPRYPRHHSVLATGPATGTGFQTATQSTSFWLGASTSSTGTVSDYREWDLMMDRGTWRFDLMHRRSTDRGIYNVTLDGVSIGTIDGYNGTADNVIGTISSFTVATSGRHLLRLSMDTKNGSSSSYIGAFSAFTTARTGS